MDKASRGRGKTIAASSAGALTEAEGARSLLDLVEGEIIPRLMHAHRDRRESPSEPDILYAESVAFGCALLERSPAPARHIVDAYLERGVRLESIFLNLFTPAARAIRSSAGLRIARLPPGRP